MLKILKYLKRNEWLMALLSLVFIVAQVWLDLKSPEYMAQITRLVQTPGSPMKDIWLAGGNMLLCTLGSLAAAVAVGYLIARVAAAFSRRVRGLLFDKVASFSTEQINLFSTDSLITRSTNDVTQVQMLITMGLQLIIKAPITAVWALTKIMGKGYEWSMATAVAVLVVIILIGFIMFFMMPKFRLMQGLVDNLNRATRENLTGLRVVRAYNAESFQEAKFEAANDELTRNQLYTARGMAVMMPTMMLVMSGLTLAIYWIGAGLINASGLLDRLTLFSNMVVFSSYAMQIIMSFMMSSMFFLMYPRASVSARRINEVLDTQPTILDGSRTEGLPGLQGEVSFRHVGFKYPDAADHVLHDISFTVRQGETIAFIGSTGSGKSTLINLIPRFFDATEGEILVDGVNIKDYTQEALRNKIGYVPQRSVLFRGTVRSNVAYGDNGQSEIADETVRRAVALAQASDFVQKMDDQYEAAIAQGGTNVSGGQKQRLSIARAIARSPEIYIFDDSFSALDYKTDRTLRSALKQHTAGVTSMIVAQRIGTVMDADQIVVLDEGRMVGQGTHKELLRSCEVYRQIAQSQLTEEELAS